MMPQLGGIVTRPSRSHGACLLESALTEPPVRRDSTPDSPRAEKSAALLIAHGSRRPEANRDLVELAYAVRGRTHYPIVEIAYLEVAEPTIPQGARRCVEQGATRVFLLPYFLSAGAHVVEDLERIRADLALRVSGSTVPPLPSFIDAPVVDRDCGRSTESSGSCGNWINESRWGKIPAARVQ